MNIISMDIKISYVCFTVNVIYIRSEQSCNESQNEVNAFPSERNAARIVVSKEF